MSKVNEIKKCISNFLKKKGYKTIVSVVGGLFAYLLLTFGISPIMDLVKSSSSWFVVQMSVIGMLFGWATALVWWIFSQPKAVLPPE